MSNELKRVQKECQARFYHNIKDMTDALKVYEKSKSLLVRGMGLTAFNEKVNHIKSEMKKFVEASKEIGIFDESFYSNATKGLTLD